MSKSRKKASELLSGLSAVIDDEARSGTDQLGERVATRMAYEWGGQKIYMPFDTVRRNRSIFSMFNGSNYDELARKFHMAEDTIRQIINQERARRRQRQFTLFP